MRGVSSNRLASASEIMLIAQDAPSLVFAVGCFLVVACSEVQTFTAVKTTINDARWGLGRGFMDVLYIGYALQRVQ